MEKVHLLSRKTSATLVSTSHIDDHQLTQSKTNDRTCCISYSALCVFFAVLLIHFIRWKNDGLFKQRYLVVDLYAFPSPTTRLGNNVFELMGPIALARKLKRTLVVHPSVYEKLKNAYPEFDNLLMDAQWNVTSRDWPIGRVYDYQSYACCKFNPAWERIKSMRSLISVKVRYIQSYKYFQSLGLEEVRRLLSISKTHQSIAREKLLGSKFLNEYDHRMCVHSRRTDFVNSTFRESSTAEFTVPAVEYILKELSTVSKRPLVIMIGDDEDWQIETSKLIHNVDIAILPRSVPSKIVSLDWHFSETYCDSVVLTASASTFGWWLAYLSKGQQVYYNSVYGSGYENDLIPEDYFPPSWISLELNRNQIKKLPRFNHTLLL